MRPRPRPTGRTAPRRLARALVAGAVALGAVLSAVPATATPSVPAPSSAPAPEAFIRTGPDWTNTAFFTAVLAGLKLPATEANLRALYSVTRREGDNDYFNPLNVVQPEPGSSAMNSVGVQAYATFETGVAGTVTLLSNSHWAGVRAALRPGNSTAAVLSAFQGAYTWDTSITFPATATVWDEESVRDVGGPFADTTAARERATTQRAALRAAISPATTALAADAAISTNAHSDYTTQRAIYSDAAPRVAAAQIAFAAAQTKASASWSALRSLLVRQYVGGGATSSPTMQLLTSSDPNAALAAAALEQYAGSFDARVMTTYVAQKRITDEQRSLLNTQQTRLTQSQAAMTADTAAWVAADARYRVTATQLAKTLQAAAKNTIVAAMASLQLKGLAV